MKKSEHFNLDILNNYYLNGPYYITTDKYILNNFCKCERISLLKANILHIPLKNMSNSQMKCLENMRLFVPAFN